MLHVSIKQAEQLTGVTVRPLTGMQLNICSMVKICRSPTSAQNVCIGRPFPCNDHESGAVRCSHSNCWFSSAFDLYSGRSDCGWLTEGVSWRSLDDVLDTFEALLSFVLLRRELAALCGKASVSILYQVWYLADRRIGRVTPNSETNANST